MNRRKREKERVFLSIFARYLILIVFGLLPFYKIFFPLTIWPVYFLLGLFYEVSVIGDVILIEGLGVQIVGACVAGSAYYLLLILNLTTDMKARQRVYSLLFSLFSLLALNVLRIFILSILFVNNFVFFDETHKLFWYVLSIVFVVGIWFLTVWIFKIKNVPIYSDLRFFKKWKKIR